MKHCTHCGGENRDQARFCGHCGKPFTTDAPRQPDLAGSNVRQAPNPRMATLKVKKPALLVSGIIVVLLAVSFFAQRPEAARRKLEKMGIPYTCDQFFQEAGSGNTEAVELFLAAGMGPNT